MAEKQMDRKKQMQKSGERNAAAKGASAAKTSGADKRIASSAKESARKSAAKAKAAAGEKTAAEKKGGKKLTSGMKKVIRRSVAGVCLASSLLIAALPSDRSGSASAATDAVKDLFTEINKENGVSPDNKFYTVDTNTGNFTATVAEILPYDGDLVLARSTQLAPPAAAPDLTKGQPTDPWTYTIGGSASTPQMYHMYQYYSTKNSGDSDAQGVISGFNKDVLIGDTLTVSNRICLSYDFYTQDQYEGELAAYRDYDFIVHDPWQSAHKVIKDETKEMDVRFSAAGYVEVASADMEALFGEKYTKLLSDYEAFRQDLQLSTGNTPTFAECVAAGWKPYIPFDGESDLIDEEKIFLKGKTRRANNTIPLKDDHELVPVDIKNMESFEDPDDERILYIVKDKGTLYATDADNKAYYGDYDQFKLYTKDTVLAVRYTGDAEDPAAMDDNGYVYARKTSVTAIGNGVFKDKLKDSAIKTVKLEDGIKYIGDEAFMNNAITGFECPYVSYIGNNVFNSCKNLDSSKLKLSDDTTSIGTQAFYNCEGLKSLTFPKGLENIGFGAFAKCYNLTSVKFSDEHSHPCDIGEYAFYDDNKLATVTFPEAYAVSLGKACFAMGGSGTDAALDFTFPKSIKEHSKKGKYTLYGADVDLWNNGKVVGLDNAQTAVESSNIKTVCAYQSLIGDFLLANRQNLGTVRIDTYGARLPMNTFMGCSQMNMLDLNPNNQNVYRSLAYDANIFRDVSNPKMYVNGPQTGANVFGKIDEKSSAKGQYAQPRVSTWATYGDGNPYVPYRFVLGEDDVHYEVGYDIEDEAAGTSESVIFDLGVNDVTKEASVKNCIYLGNSTELGKTEESPFMIPAQVHDYTVTTLENDCLKDVKDRIVYFKVPDDSLKSINDRVFNKSEKLKGVDLGNSVAEIGANAFSYSEKLETLTIGEGIQKIGASAFEGCERLMAVYWDEPDGNGVVEEIGSKAFLKIGTDTTVSATTDPKLYFYGKADDREYVPFKYAMEGSDTDGKGLKICYRSPVPLTELQLTALKRDYAEGEENFTIPTMSMMYHRFNTGGGEVVLIDYPHIEDMPKHLKEAVKNNTPLSDGEQALLNSTLFIEVPPVVDSIDVAGFLNDEDQTSNQQNRVYLELERLKRYTGTASYTKAKDPFTIYAAAADTEKPGLFSGNSQEDEQTFLVDSGLVDKARGNDWIKSVNLPRVTGIPEYAFDSCERLQSVNIGEVCNEVGKLAFHDCVAMTSIGTGYTDLNPNFAFENYILYQHKEDGTEEINVCLPGRGNTQPAQKIYTTLSTESDPTYLKNVSSIGESAFHGCEFIDTVDLSEAGNLKKIGPDCFSGCEMLANAYLPDSVTQVNDGAFTGCANSLFVKIPNYNTRINAAAFDKYDKIKKNKVTIQTPKDSLAYGITNEPDASPENVHIYWVGYTSFIVRFFNDDRVTQIGDTQIIEVAGSNARIPDTGSLVSTKNPSAQFTGWEWTDTKKGVTVTGAAVVENINEDRDIYATYKTVMHTVRFQNDDTTEITTRLIEDGGSFPYVDTSTLTTKLYTPASDYVFSKWLYNVADFNPSDPVTTDVICTAFFVNKNAPQNPTPTGSASENTPTPTNGGGGNNNATPTGGGNGGTTATPTPAGGGNSATPTGSASQNRASGTGYFAIVENGSGSGQYPQGSVVTITAFAPPEGRTFDRWTTSNTDIGISNALAVSTTFIMPSHDVKVTATYRSAASASGNNASRITPVPNSDSGNNVYVTATPTPAGRNNGTEVVITTDTIDNNKKNRGSASVAGSTDNFIVKVTDSAAATAAVEAALRNAYGDRFTSLRYAAFDISLYDSTGTYLVSNANNLAVTITLPIPEALLAYGGNNKAGAVVNGQLQELAVNYTTIDGIPCMRFTATHFSPYTIYVDTDNVVRGVTDITPKTGDGIAPKWFLSAGMLSVSCVLFLWKDKKNPLLVKEENKKK